MDSFKPSNFFLALFDFLGIFVPGAVFLFVLLDVDLIRQTIADEFDFDDQLKSIAGFLFGSYFLGHMVYLLGSRFLGGTHETWMSEKKSNKYASYVVDLFKKCDPYFFRLESSRSNTIEKRIIIAQFLDGKIENIFKPFYRNANRSEIDENKGIGEAVWRFVNSIVISDNASAADQLERTRAESRFFRTMTVVLFFSFLIFLVKLHVGVALLCLVFFVLSWLRFAERRLKHEAETYNYFVAMITGRWGPEPGASTPSTPAAGSGDGSSGTGGQDESSAITSEDQR